MSVGGPSGGRDLGGLLAERLALLGLGVVAVGPDSTVTDVDDVACAILGRERDDLLTLADVALVLAPEERGRQSAYRQRRLAGGNGNEVIRTVAVMPDGGRRAIEVAILPEDDGATVMIVRDASELANRDQYLDWYTALLDRMPIGVAIFDANGVDDPADIRLWAANQAAAAATGVDLPARVGQPVAAIFPGGSSAAEAARALALRGTLRIEHFGDLVRGDAGRPDAVHRRTVVALPDGALALLFEDITRERLDDLRLRRLTARVVRAADMERRAIAMGVHDDPLQHLAAVSFLTAQLRRRADGGPPDDEWLAEIEQGLGRAVRALRRLTFELVPPELVESGLDAAIRIAADHLFGDTDVAVHLDCDIAGEPPAAVQTTAFRIVSEALGNARRHACATKVEVSIVIDGGELAVTVADDGSGIHGVAAPGHVGMQGMRDRADAIGGSLAIDTSPAGTVIAARLPLTPATIPEDGLGPRDLGDRVDAVARSLRLERDSLREAEAAAVASAHMAWRRLRTMTRLGTVLRDAPHDRSVRAHLAAREIAETVRDACAIRLIDNERGLLRRVASWHEDPDQLALLDRWLFADRPLDASPAALVFRSAQPLLLDRDRMAWREAPAPATPTPYAPHTAILAPLRVGTTTLGVLSVVRDRSPDRLGTPDVSFVAVVADLVAAALTV